MSSRPPPYTPRAERFPESYPTTPKKGNNPQPKPRNINHFLRTPGEGPAMSGTSTETKGKAPAPPKTPSRPNSLNEGESGKPRTLKPGKSRISTRRGWSSTTASNQQSRRRRTTTTKETTTSQQHPWKTNYPKNREKVRRIKLRSMD